MTLEAIRYNYNTLEILDQLLLPRETQYISINNTDDGWNAINKMQVRGAPAIAIVGCLSLAVEMYPMKFSDKDMLKKFTVEKLNYLVTARPTAVNMSRARHDMKKMMDSLMLETDDVASMKTRIIKTFEEMLEKDINDNKAIGDFGADHIQKHCPGELHTIITHCNTGSLATAGYGTALGVIRSLHQFKILDHVYCTETRPYNQGARLTAYELVYEKIPSTLICDSMVAAVLSSKNISAVVVGADRVAANGDTANKIGTLQLAVLAKHYKVPFYVAAPWTSIDLTLPNGTKIPIEERPPSEMTFVDNVPIAAPGINCWNPAFDVTPAHLITGGIITEKGVFTADSLEKKQM